MNLTQKTYSLRDLIFIVMFLSGIITGIFKAYDYAMTKIREIEQNTERILKLADAVQDNSNDIQENTDKDKQIRAKVLGIEEGLKVNDKPKKKKKRFLFF
jgi:hypothetical protein